MNKSELIEALAAEARLAKPDATRAVDLLFGPEGIIARELAAGRRVQVTGFGTFHARARAAREGRDPRTGATITIAAAAIPAFKAGQPLKDAVARRS